MNFTNLQQLPTALHQFLQYNDYNPGGPKFDISCTKLIDSPQIAGYWKEHGRDVEEDSATRVYSAMGSGIHSRFEQANASNAAVLMEKRFLGEFAHPLDRDPFICGTPFIKSGVPIPDTSDWEKDPLIVSGQIDTYEFATRTLADLKTVSAWKLVNKDYSSFEKQLNVCALLMAMNGFEVEKLQVFALVRDFSKARASESDYPSSPIQVIDIELWDRETQEDFVAKRLELHFGEGERTCTDAERWAKPASYAVKAKGRKRALRVLPTEAKATSWMESQGKGDSIETRPATYVRCEGFCPFGKMGVCSQYNQTKEV